MVFKTNYRLMQIKSIAECSKGGILQYFRPALSYHLSLRSLFYRFLSFTVNKFLFFSEDDDHRKIVEITEEHILNYAMQGLRTLCMAKKVRHLYDISLLSEKEQLRESAINSLTWTSFGNIGFLRKAEYRLSRC